MSNKKMISYCSLPRILLILPSEADSGFGRIKEPEPAVLSYNKITEVLPVQFVKIPNFSIVIAEAGQSNMHLKL